MAYRTKCAECDGRGRCHVDGGDDDCWWCDGRGYTVSPVDDMEAAMDDDDLDAMIDVNGEP